MLIASTLALERPWRIAALGDLGGRALAEPVALGRDQLELPSSSDGPEASPQLLRAVDQGDARLLFDRRDLWRVPAIVLSPDALLDLALQLPSGPVGGVAVGDSLRLCAGTTKLALELVARGRLRARLERRGDSWVARWRPVADGRYAACAPATGSR